MADRSAGSASGSRSRTSSLVRGGVGHHPPGVERVPARREPGLVREQRVVAAALAAAEVEDGVAAGLAPPPHLVVEQLVGVAIAGPAGGRDVSGGDAVVLEERVAADHLVALQRDREVHPVADGVVQRRQVLAGEEVVRRRADPAHVVVIDGHPLAEPVPVVEHHPGAVPARPVDVVAVVAAGLPPHLLEADGQVHRDRLAVPDHGAEPPERRPAARPAADASARTRSRCRAARSVSIIAAQARSQKPVSPAGRC